MSSIIPTISSHKLNQAQFYQKISSTLSGITIGEILETGIIEKLGDRNVLIALKGLNIPAETDVTLNVGDKLRVQVERLHPQMILRIVETGSQEESMVTDYLKLYRSNPDAFSTMMTEAMKHFSPENMDKLFCRLSGDDSHKIVNILKSLFLSSKTLDNNFLKNYLNNLGLLTESQLRKIIEGESGSDKGNFQPQNLKSLFIQLSEDIRNVFMGRETYAPEELKLLQSLSEYVDSSIKTIESQQIINYVLQESENKYLFQIPLLFPECVRKGDIFIEYDRNAGRGEQNGKYRIIIFLSMDILGDMIIDAHLTGGKINCCIKCSAHEIRDFISPFLEELREKLNAIGCKLDAVNCIAVAGGDLIEEKNDYCQGLVLYSSEVINLFA
ncbi:MAG: hypothetical protein ABFD82_10505 [Syntrophaceae bacterium]